MGRRRAKTVAFNNNTTTTPHRAALAECTLLLLRRLPHVRVVFIPFKGISFFFSRAKKGRVERYARQVVRKQRACPCSLVFETTKKATISVQTAIATKTAMSFWDSVTTGAQNAAETTKLVSIVRPLFFSAFCCVLSPFSNSIAPRTTTVVYAGTDTRTNTRTLSLSPKTTQRTKLQAEVLYLEQQIKQIMQNFGVECFPHMEQSNSGLVQQAFLNAQRGIEEYRTKIEEKNREINELNQQIENVGR